MDCVVAPFDQTYESADVEVKVTTSPEHAWVAEAVTVGVTVLKATVTGLDAPTPLQALEFVVVTVYVPHSYAISGITYIVSVDRIKKMPKGVNASEAMKYVVSGGVTTVDDAENESTMHIGNTNTEG